MGISSKTAEDWAKEGTEIAALLPTKPPKNMTSTFYAEDVDAFGGNVTIFHRVPYVETPELQRLMTPNDWEEYDRNTRHAWAAECHCSACGEVWMAGWSAGGGVNVYMGEDGMLYEGVPNKAEDDARTWIVFNEGESIVCPSCLAQSMLVRKSRIRDQWTNQLMICTVMNAGTYTALVWWLARRTLFEDGDFDLSTEPVYASVIMPDGGLRFFRSSTYDSFGRVWPDVRGWTPCGMIEPEQARYYDHDAFNHNLVGAVYWREVPEQLGQTGEKTGLEDYIRTGGEYPLQYLRWWKDHPEIENLVKAGWVRAISGAISGEVQRALDYHMGKVHKVEDLGELFKWGCKRPHDLLMMTKTEERKARGWDWDCRRLALWSEMIDYGIAAPGDAELIHDAICRYGFDNIIGWEGHIMDGWEGWYLNEFDRYLQQQERRHDLPPIIGFEMLMDYRLMLPEDAPAAELWPANLRAAHDALAQTVKLNETKEMTEGFARVLAKWGALDWTDGQISIRLARSQAELVEEGRVLHHCVGRYEPNHIKEDVILFVRRARRPERSWYTLNIDLRGYEPREVQLHGYGNEWARGMHLRIPDAVRAAVDRWKAEVLTPVFLQVAKAEAANEEAQAQKKQKRERKKKENVA